MAEGTNGWETWAKRVLGDIERLEGNEKEIFDKINSLRVDMAVLQTKAAFIGGFWGAIVSIIVAVISYIVIGHVKG
jgi:hypothetical protein